MDILGSWLAIGIVGCVVLLVLAYMWQTRPERYTFAGRWDTEWKRDLADSSTRGMAARALTEGLSSDDPKEVLAAMRILADARLSQEEKDSLRPLLSHLALRVFWISEGENVNLSAYQDVAFLQRNGAFVDRT